MEDVRWITKPPGLWIGNVFYSEDLASRFLETMIRREEERVAKFIDDLPSDTER